MTTTSNQRRLLIRTAGVVAFLILFHYVGVLRPIERYTLRLLSPIGKASLAIFHRSGHEGLSPAELRQRVTMLEERVADLSVKNVRLEQALDASGEVTQQQAFLQAKNLRGVQAQTIARSPDPTIQYIVSDAGNSRGVRVGSPAIVQNGIVIGTVIAVDDESSRILLTTDNRSTFAAVFIDNQLAQGSVSGVRGLSLRMDLIPISETIREGEIAVTSGVDPNISPGLILGEVDRVEKQQGAILQSASLRPLYTASRIDTLTILTTP